MSALHHKLRLTARTLVAIAIAMSIWGTPASVMAENHREEKTLTFGSRISLEDVIPSSGAPGTPGVLKFPANALNYDGASTIITQVVTGLRWQSNFASGAYVMVPRPADWDGTSNVELRLYFQTTSSASGNVDFFIRPRAFNPGDTFSDASSLSGTAVPVSSNLLIQSQSFSIPASRFGAKELWVITVQREDSGETYTDDVILHSVELRYTAIRNIYLPLVMKN